MNRPDGDGLSHSRSTSRFALDRTPSILAGTSSSPSRAASSFADKAEGFTLSEMRGFGGERLWSNVSTALESLLDRPDDGGGELSPAECAAILPRLKAITEQWQNETGDPLLQQHIDDARQLTVVLRLCVAKEVDLLFL